MFYDFLIDVCQLRADFMCTFARMNDKGRQNTQWAENVILVDADYVDKVVFNLTVNFERMIGRRIPPADMARWVDCVALDGGLRASKQAGSNEVQVILIHDKESAALSNFTPGQFADELHGKAFKDHLGEFSFQAYPVEELTTKERFLADVLQMVCQQKGVRRLMVIPNAEAPYAYDHVRQVLRQHGADDRQVTLFTMQPATERAFRHELLGFSLMAALGISSEELSPDE